MHIWGREPRVLAWSYRVRYLLNNQKGVIQEAFRFRSLKFSGVSRTTNVKLGVGRRGGFKAMGFRNKLQMRGVSRIKL